MRNFLPLIVWQVRLLLWLWQNRTSYAVVKASDLDTALPGLLVAKLFGKPFLYDIHDFYADSRYVPAPLIRAVRTLEKWVASQADVLILPDQCRLDQVRGCRSRRILIIYNTPGAISVDPRASIQIPAEAFRIGYVGILSKRRGLLALLDVMTRRPEWRLELGGYGTDDPEIERKITELPNVIFHGRVSFADAIEIYSRANVILCTYDPAVPNHRYSSPNKLAEALMLGKPLIVAEGTNIDAIVRDSQLGLCVPYGDARALERALASISSWDADETQVFVRRAQTLYEEKYSWNAMRDSFLHMLMDLDGRENTAASVSVS